MSVRRLSLFYSSQSSEPEICTRANRREGNADEKKTNAQCRVKIKIEKQIPMGLIWCAH